MKILGILLFAALSGALLHEYVSSLKRRLIDYSAICALFSEIEKSAARGRTLDEAIKGFDAQKYEKEKGYNSR